MTDHEKQELASRYNPAEVEDKWYRCWEENAFFHSEPDPGKKPYTIVIPPPNVTGVLHMGHALNNTIQDILIRWRRMEGRNALWMPGTDHAGIATQNVVEKELAKRGLKRHDLGREKLIEEIWKWREQYGSTIIKQLKKLGSSCDWARERFTMDSGLSRAVREAFVRLYEQGLIYRGKRIVNWCPHCLTALADDEVEMEDHEGHLWYLKYPFKDHPHLCVTVATTRPETMLGDVAVAVNPKDERYKELIGATLVLPVVDREIPIIADDKVEPEFGTGAVKVTPAHDPNDFEMGARHNLTPLVVMNPNATMNDLAGDYAGQDRYECREALVEELRQKKLLAAVEPYKHVVGHCYRCHTPIEPSISDQWFVKMKPLAEKAIEATQKGEVVFHPERWTRIYLSWLENVRDWCISRQIWWGHRIPAWYCECGKITVGRTDPAQCAHCGAAGLKQDEDVLDTWFSSSLWPFSTLGWPDETPELKHYYPTDVLVTDRGIIYFWVARMVMMGCAMGLGKPYGHVYIHGTVLDELGRKMSKSLGNGIDPLEMIQQYGADAVRFSLMMLTTEGQDVKLSVNKFEMGRNFANKIWNATRFALMNLSNVTTAAPISETPLEDRWILSRLHTTSQAVTDNLEKFQFNEAARQIYDFTWREFCDWYIEIIKPRLKGDTPGRMEAGTVLVRVLDAIMRMLHPFAPFVTEELWQNLKRQVETNEAFAPLRDGFASATVMHSAWPPADAALRDPQVESAMAIVQGLVRGVRNIRSNMEIEERKPLAAIVSCPDEAMVARLRPHAGVLQKLAYLDRAEMGVQAPKPKASAVEVVETVQLFVPLEGVIDLDKERERLLTRIGHAQAMLKVCEGKLANENFVKRAPVDVVEKERARKQELTFQIEKLQRNYEDLA